MSRNYKSIVAVIELLATAFPKSFWILGKRRRPLKVGIHADILAASKLEPKVLRAALRFYCLNTRYLLACREGAMRIDLNGEPCGSVTAEEAACARERLEKLQDKYKRRQEATERKARNNGRLSFEGLRRAAQARRAA